MKLAALCLVAAAAAAAAASTRGQPAKAVNAAGVVTAPPDSLVNAQLQKASAAEEAAVDADGGIHSHMHSHGHAFKSGKGCGHSVPHFSQTLRELQEAAPNSPPETVMDKHGRRTQSSFKPAAQAVIDGEGGPIRIALVWEVVDAGEQVPGSGGILRQCLETSPSIRVVAEGVSTPDSATHICSDSDRVDPNSAMADADKGFARYSTMKRRTEWARNYWQDALKVQRAVSPIALSSFVQNTFPQISTLSYPDTDLVVVMTARPSPNLPIAGFALCMQYNAFDRCEVGHFNWVPEIFEIDDDLVNRQDTIAAERHTALHEFAHIFGAVLVPETASERNPFHNADGSKRPLSEISVTEAESAHYTKSVVKVRLPGVLDLAKESFACDDMTGLPLEDVPLGKGAHWESRVLGPELMSYGSSVGEVYVSDFTLAFLDETRLYSVNFTAAGGRLVVPEAADFTINSFDFLKAVDSQSEDRYEPPAPLSPGYPRWGRGQGCPFVHSSPNSWNERYTCREHQEYGCSPDNKETGVCVLNDAIAVSPSAPFTCQGKSGPCDSGPADGTLPAMYRYFTDSQASDAFPSFTGSFSGSTTGGFSSSMDYVPVRLGYWNCQDLRGQAGNSSRGAEEGVDSSLTGGLFGSSVEEEQALFGGQANCPECRCFRSSLIEISSGVFDPRFPAYGLCYRSNCYRPDYLQVAIKNQIGGVSWYKCPAKGGKLYIAGFTGALTCPDAEQFCIQEEVTGIKYPETDIFTEFIFYGVLTFSVIFFTCVFFVPCCRDRVVGCCKYRCGVLTFDPIEEYYRKNGTMPDDPELELVPDERAGYVLLGLNTLALWGALIVMGVAIYALSQDFISSAATPFITLGVFATIISCLGMVGARKSALGINCAVILFFYAAIMVILTIIWVVVYVNAFADNWEVYVDRNFDVITDAFPGVVDETAPREQQVEQATQALLDNASIIVGMLVAVAVLYVVGAFQAGKIMERFRVISTTYIVLNVFSMVFGVLFLGGAIYFFTLNGNGLDFSSTGGAIVAMGALFLILGVVGYVGGGKRAGTAVMTHLVITIASVAAALAAAYYSFQAAADVPGEVAAMSDKEVEERGAVNGAGTREDLVVALQDQLRVAGLTAAMVAIMLIILIVAGVFMFKAIGTYKQDQIALERARRKASKKASKGYDQDASAARKDKVAKKRAAAAAAASASP